MDLWTMPQSDIISGSEIVMPLTEIRQSRSLKSAS
jgi:hypothetical protein